MLAREDRIPARSASKGPLLALRAGMAARKGLKHLLAQLLELPQTSVQTVLQTLLVLMPSVLIVVMHTVIMRASMTAYSVAVGPSSAAMKFLTHACAAFISLSSSKGDT